MGPVLAPMRANQPSTQSIVDRDEELVSRTTKPKSAGLPPEQPQDRSSSKDELKLAPSDKDSSEDDQKPGEHPPQYLSNEPAATLGMLLSIGDIPDYVLCRKWADKIRIVNSQRMEMIKCADMTLSGRIRARAAGFETMAKGGIQTQFSSCASS